MKKLILAILLTSSFTDKSTAQDKQLSLSYDVAYELINEDGCKLELLSPEFKRNKAIVKIVVENCPSAYQHADESLKNRCDIILLGNLSHKKIVNYYCAVSVEISSLISFSEIESFSDLSLIINLNSNKKPIIYVSINYFTKIALRLYESISNTK
jgi:hypothetical protein